MHDLVRVWRTVGAAVLAALPWFAQAGDEPPWQRPYVDDQATGQDVVALWQFDAGREARDSSGHGHDLTLRGDSRFAADGRFGSCLESFPADAQDDRAQGALAKNHPDLSPPGAFTLELWFKTKPEIDRYANAFLLDKKYYHYAKDLPQANRDYCLYLRRSEGNRRQIVAHLGFGTDSAQFTSRVVSIEPGRWYHVAFTYDGAGTGRIFLNGRLVGRTTHQGRGAVTPGKYPLVIGCRYGSIHAGFPGYIDQVRISRGIVPFFAGSLEVDLAGRRLAYVRMEPDACVSVGIRNDTGKPLDAGAVRVELGGDALRVRLPPLAPQQVYRFDAPVDTRLRPGAYRLRVAALAADADKPYVADETYTLFIVPRPLPHRMPVVMWGSGDLQTVKQIGFTHQLVGLVDYRKIWLAGEPTEAVSAGRAAELAEMLDRYLVEGIGAVAQLSPGRWLMSDAALRERFQRIDRNGKPYARANTCALFPEVQAFARNVGASVARTFGHFPALKAALIHTEIRDGTNLCFHAHDRQAYRQAMRRDIPPQAASKGGIAYSKIEGFPADRIVPDDDPLLAFYRWFWKRGDGWNDLHTLAHQGLKSTGRRDVWTFFDPAVRAPSVWGSGGGVDVLSQWTYSYPDPIKIGQATDELFAMAAGAPHEQRVMKMTQIIWYRSQTAPDLPQEESARAAWERKIPDARFITIAPDHLREAFWSKIARPVQGIMYHGWGSLVDASHGSYRFTNPQTRGVLTELIDSVVRPLGPTLLQVPDRPADVALLESFASQMFAGRGTYGWSRRWEADMHLVCQWAQLQPRIVYDETILRDGLDDFRVLVLPCGDVLSEPVAAAIAQFQHRGGILVADQHLAPTLKADVVVPSYQRSGKADVDKQTLQARAAALRRQLDPHYQRYGDSSNPDLIVRCRQFGSTDYLFVVNDQRTFGSYVGHHGKVMEKGLPGSSRLSARRTGGYVYDLVTHRPMPAANEDDRLTWDVRLGPGDGRVFMIASHPIGGVKIDTPANASLGNRLEFDVEIVGQSGQPLDAVVPVQVEILDPKARPAEFSGYYGAKGGRLSIRVDLAPNDLAGAWAIRATELASGQSKKQPLRVHPSRSGP